MGLKFDKLKDYQKKYQTFRGSNDSPWLALKDGLSGATNTSPAPSTSSGTAYTGPSFEDRKNKYGTYLRTKDPGQLADNLNRLVGVFTPEEKDQIWADSGQTTPFAHTQQAAPKSRWDNRFNGWSAPDGSGRRYQVGGQPATAAEVAAGYPPAQNPAVTGGSQNTTSGNGFGPIEIAPQQQDLPSNPPNASGAPEVKRSSINNSDYGYDPALGTVNAQTDTVAGQMSGLLSRASPFITRARTAAAQTMNARGGLNTSMAAGAGEAAAIDAALPIATADAGTYSAQRIANQSATNLSRESGSVEANKAYLLQKSGEINSQLENLRAKNISQLSAQEAQQLQALTAQKGAIDQQLQMLVGSQQSALQTERIDAQTSWNTAQQNADMTLQLLRGDQSTALSQIESDNRMLLQTSQAASQRSIYNSQALATIMSNPDTTEAQKQAAVDRQLSLYRSDLSIIGGIGDVDLLKLLDFSTPESTTTPAPTVDLSAIDNSNLLLR